MILLDLLAGVCHTLVGTSNPNFVDIYLSIYPEVRQAVLLKLI